MMEEMQERELLLSQHNKDSVQQFRVARNNKSHWPQVSHRIVKELAVADAEGDTFASQQVDEERDGTQSTQSCENGHDQVP